MDTQMLSKDLKFRNYLDLHISMMFLKHSLWVFLWISAGKDSLQLSRFGRGNGRLILQLRFYDYHINTIQDLENQISLISIFSKL
jgi:hypothetical protein